MTSFIILYLIPYLIPALYFIFGFGLLIFIHEFGHFLMAKKAGVRVEKFSLGFGPRLVGFTRGETEYRISAVPLGGYVKMWGEEPEEGATAPLDDPRSFAAQPLRKRIGVVLAGPLMNIFLALLLLPLAYIIGVSIPSYQKQPPVIVGVLKDSPAQKIGLEKGDQILKIDKIPTPYWNDLAEYIIQHPHQEATLHILGKRSGKEEIKSVRIEAKPPIDMIGFLGIEPGLFMVSPIVGEVVPNSAAQEMKILPGDRILSVDSEKIENTSTLSEKIEQSQGRPLVLEILRNERLLSLTITPHYNPHEKRWLMGIVWKQPHEDRAYLSYPASKAFQKGFSEIVWQTKITFITLKKIFTFESQAYKTVGGPIQIARVTSQAAEFGFGNFLVFLAAISLQLGIFNLLPIPVLDGGHFLFMIYEAVRRKPLSIRKRMVAQQVGMVLLLTLTVVVTIKDLGTLDGIQKLVGRISGWF